MSASKKQLIDPQMIFDQQICQQCTENMQTWDWKVIVSFVGIVASLGWNLYNSCKTTRLHKMNKQNEIRLRQFDKLIGDPILEILREYESLSDSINAAFLSNGEERCKRLKELTRNDFNKVRQRIENILVTADKSNITEREDFFSIASDHHDTIANGFNAMCNDALQEENIKQGKDKAQKGILDLRVALSDILTEESKSIIAGKK